MSDANGDSNNISNKSTAPETISSNEEKLILKAPIHLAESGPEAVPSHLHVLCSFLQEATPAAFLTAALQLLMLESGFVIPRSELTPEESSQLSNSQLIIECKTAKDGSENSFAFTLLEVSGCICKLIITKMKDILLVNSLSNMPVVTYSVVLPIEYYVPCPDALTIYQKYDHLEELSLTFKNAVSTPARAAILAAKGIAAASLVGLPPEILNKILEYCGPISVCKVALTCRALSVSAKEPRLWYFFFNDHFPEQVESVLKNEEIDWVKEYRMAFKPRWRFKIRPEGGYVKLIRV